MNLNKLKKMNKKKNKVKKKYYYYNKNQEIIVKELEKVSTSNKQKKGTEKIFNLC